MRNQRKKPQSADPLLSSLSGVGRGLKDLFMVSASHPTIACLALMGFSSVVRCLVPIPSKADSHAQTIRNEMSGLYNGAQGALVALAAVQVYGSIGEKVASALVPAKAPP